MAKKNTNAPAPAGALSAEEFQKLSPEEQLAAFTALQSAKAAADEKAAAATEVVEKAGLVALPTIKGVPADEDNEVEAGDYQFTAPTLTYDDNKVYKAVDIVAALSSSDKKEKAHAEEIVANLLARKSGLLQIIKKED